MPKQIIVPLDGSRLAEKALPHAVALARATGSGLTLLQAVPTASSAGALAWAVPFAQSAVAREEVVESARKYLRSVAQHNESAGAGVPLQVELVEGDAAEGIILHVEQDPNAAMIVMATNGRSGLSRWVLGSVAEKVLQAAPVPLALIRPAEVSGESAGESQVGGSAFEPSRVPRIPEYKTILVPLDGSPLAEEALEQARALAAAIEATLLLVSVTPLPDHVDLMNFPAYVPGSALIDPRTGRPPPPDAGIGTWVRVLYEREKGLLAHYQAWMAHNIKSSSILVRTRLLEGNAANEILRASREEGADLIVMSTRGRGGPAPLWPGSVAMGVVREAALPVLLVRSNLLSRPELQGDQSTPGGESSSGSPGSGGVVA